MARNAITFLSYFVFICSYENELVAKHWRHFHLVEHVWNIELTVSSAHYISKYIKYMNPLKQDGKKVDYFMCSVIFCSVNDSAKYCKGQYFSVMSSRFSLGLVLAFTIKQLRQLLSLNAGTSMPRGPFAACWEDILLVTANYETYIPLQLTAEFRSHTENYTPNYLQSVGQNIKRSLTVSLTREFRSTMKQIPPVRWWGDGA